MYTVYDNKQKDEFNIECFNGDQSNEKPFLFMEVHTEYMKNKVIDLLSVQQMHYHDKDEHNENINGEMKTLFA